MADGSVVIEVTADDKEAQKRLNELRRSIEKTEKAIESTSGKKAAITEQLEQAKQAAAETAEELKQLYAQKRENDAVLSGKSGSVDVEEMAARKQSQDEITYAIKEQLKLQEKQASTIQNLTEKEAGLSTQLEKQTAELEQQKTEAGEVQRVIATQASSVMPQLAATTEAVSSAMRKGVKSILRWGFGIRSAFILIRRLRSAVIEGVKAFAEQDEETRNNINGLKASLSTLKTSWGAAFAPIFNAVVPILQRLISWLTAAANAIAAFFAALGGKSSYKKAVTNNAALASSYGAAGDAAEEAKGQIMGFDEINQLTSNSSKSGGGGGGSATEFVDEAINPDSLAAKMAFTMKDVLFNWDELTPEDIAAKALAGLTTLGGAIVGGMIGGVPGAIIGAAAGLLLGIALDSTVFNFDGQLSQDELFTALALALPVVGGAVIGFVLGGPAGAAIGIGLGLIIDFIAFEIGIDNIKQKISEWATEVKNYFKKYIDSWLTEGSEDGAKIGFFTVLGILEGIIRAQVGLSKWVYENLIKPLVDIVCNLLGIKSPSKVFAEIGEQIVAGLLQGAKDKWKTITDFFTDSWNRLKSWWSGLSLGSFHIPMPHFSISGYFSLNPPSIPSVSVQWYAKGGIVDGATLIGAGEAGKEAIVPLERNTGWINMVADGIIDRLMSSNALADFISGRALPAVASGQIVPPNATGNGGNALSDSDISRLVSGFMASLAPMLAAVGSRQPMIATLNVNGREFCRATFYDQQDVVSEHGISLITR